MKYPYIEKQTFMQWILNTITPSMYFRPKECECSWQIFPGTKSLTWIILAGCPRHD